MVGILNKLALPHAAADGSRALRKSLLIGGLVLLLGGLGSRADTRHISISAENGGTVSPEGDFDVDVRDDVLVTATPDA